MKIPVKPLRSNDILYAALFIAVVSLALTFSLQLQRTADKGRYYFAVISQAPHYDEKELFLAAADFSLTHQQGKHESIEHSICSSAQSIKIIRSAIFDEAQKAVLTQRLAWFTQPVYFHTLSAIWHPSIPIAHRKLVI